LGDCVTTAKPSCTRPRASTLPRRPDSGTRRSSAPVWAGHWKTTAFEVRSMAPTRPTSAPRAWRRSAIARRAPRRSSITAAGPAAVFDDAYARLPRQIAGAYSEDVAVEARRILRSRPRWRASRYTSHPPTGVAFSVSPGQREYTATGRPRASGPRSTSNGTACSATGSRSTRPSCQRIKTCRPGPTASLHTT
jgi:hypothetical protein